MENISEGISNIIRASARPAISVILAATIAHAIMQGMDVPDWFVGMAVPGLPWWFVKETIKESKNNE